MKKVFKFLLLGAAALWTAAAMAAVDVNKADVADLDSIKGIGPSTSSRIIEARKAGPFKDWTDFVDRVRGIGPGNAAKLSDNGLTINGQSFKGVAAAAPAAAKPATKPAAAAAAAAASAPAPAAAATATATAGVKTAAEPVKKP